MNFGSRKNETKGGARSRVAPASVIAVASGKGGVGKTWLSTTLAACFAKMGRRTLLVDGDLGLANVDVQLGIAPETDLAAVIAGWVELEDAVCKVNGALAVSLRCAKSCPCPFTSTTSTALVKTPPSRVRAWA